jgi:hypothetical protein
MRIAVVIAFGLAGCVLRDDIVHLTLRDPAQVAVHAHGGPELLAPAATRGDIPATAQAYVHDPIADSWLVRDGALIEAWCPHCRNAKRRPVVASAELAFEGTADEVVRFEGGMLHARYVFKDGIPGRRGRLVDYPRIQLDVVTPASNIAALEYESKVSDRNGGPPDTRRPFEIGGIVFGGAYALGGVALGALGAHTHTAGVEITGGAMIAVGMGVIAFAWHELAARDTHMAIAIPR